MGNNQSLENEMRRTLLEIQHVEMTYLKDVERANSRISSEKDRITLYDLRNTDGTVSIVPLLLAKAQLLNGIATLKGFKP